MIQLLNLFFEICLFRRGPQDVPASAVLLRLSVLLYLAAGVILLAVDGSPLWQSAAKALLDFGLLAGMTWVVLRWRGHQGRFAQTLTALAGTGALLALVALPVVYWLHAGAAAGQVDALAALAWFAILIWSLAVIGHILRHALEVALAAAILLAVAYLAVSVVVVGLLFPTGVEGG